MDPIDGLERDDANLGGVQVLEHSIGRYMFTSFVLPLPCGGAVWNMTQLQPAIVTHDGWLSFSSRMDTTCSHTS